MSFVDLVLPIAAATAVPVGLEAAWRDGLIAVATTKIKPRWDSAVGTDAKWLAKVATPSNQAWKSFPSAGFISKRGRSKSVITSVQLKKLTQSSTKAIAAFDASLTGGAGGFTEQVAAKSANWSAKVLSGLGLTGDRQAGTRGPTSIVVRLAAGEPSFAADIPGGVTVTGEPFPENLATPLRHYLRPTIRRQFAAAAEGKLLQFGVLLLEGYESDTTPMNVILDDLLRGFVPDDQYIDSTTNYIHYEGTGPYVLHAHFNNGEIPL
jgi:hypothetical protein